MTDRVDTAIYAEGKVKDEIASSLSSFAEYVSSQTLSKTLELHSSEEAPEDAAEVEFNQTNIKIHVRKCQ